MSDESVFAFELKRFTISNCAIETLDAMALGSRRGWALTYDASAKLHSSQNTFSIPSVSMLTVLSLDISHERKETKKSKSASEKLVVMEFHFISFFQFEKGVELPDDKEFYRDFALNKGFELTHPYIQEFVASMTHRLGFPLLMLGISEISPNYLEME